MSKRINVNPDHYKVAGRERPGSVASRTQRVMNQDADASRERWLKRQRERQKAR